MHKTHSHREVYHIISYIISYHIIWICISYQSDHLNVRHLWMWRPGRNSWF